MPKGKRENVLLKDSLGPLVPVRIAGWIGEVHPGFDAAGFTEAATTGLEGLELFDRSRQLSAALADYLPVDRGEAISILTRSLPSESQDPGWSGVGGFTLLPYSMFVADHGLDHFEEALKLQYEVTKRFTSEFSIRNFLLSEPERTLARLSDWVTDDNEHVRRLVSEGTRPRLPWAMKLQPFVDDPKPVIALLERLKADPSLYVRRSVSNNLNDITKDHPDLVLEIAERWMREPNPDMRWIVRRGLRTLIKDGNQYALEILGFSTLDSGVEVNTSITPSRVAIGKRVSVDMELINSTDVDVAVWLDFGIDFVRTAGAINRKMFRGAELILAAGSSQVVQRSVSMAQLSTRRVMPGEHQVVVMVNGVTNEAGSFQLEP